MKPISIKDFSGSLKELLDALIDAKSQPECALIHRAVCATISEQLVNGHAVNLPGVGTLYPATRAARRKKCGLTGEVLDWPEVKTVRLRVSKVVKRELNK